ncbi:MAG: hypothetical protein EAS52_03435 [Parapedobacter sp.]|nr:MAG: hypothetical protein EAS52_03435 [Parapedobacter sp.]
MRSQRGMQAVSVMKRYVQKRRLVPKVEQFLRIIDHEQGNVQHAIVHFQEKPRVIT